MAAGLSGLKPPPKGNKGNKGNRKTLRPEENRDPGYSSDDECESKGGDDTQERIAQRRRCVSPDSQAKALAPLPCIEALPAPAVAVREFSVSALAFAAAAAPAPAPGGIRRQNSLVSGLPVAVDCLAPPSPPALRRGPEDAFAFADMVLALGDIASASAFPEFPDPHDIDKILREMGCLDVGTEGLFTSGQ